MKSGNNSQNNVKNDQFTAKVKSFCVILTDID